MIFIETTIFTKRISDYLSDEEYQKLQLFLLQQPDRGTLIQGTESLRKLWWSTENKGKRSGVRVIYYWPHGQTIYLMIIYAKNEISNLSTQDKKVLKQMLERCL